MKKKIAILFTSLVLILSSNSYANDTYEPEGTNQELPQARIDYQHISDSSFRGTSYDKTITVKSTSTYGNNLNVYVENRGSVTVVFRIDINGSYYKDVKVASGYGHTMSIPCSTFQKVRVHVNTTNGSVMNLNVQARQYV